ncbi:MAG: DUF5615 family PIN-like protein [Candidatus Hodarchaeales archaeon]
MKYLIDMALSPKTVEFLKKKGYIAVRINEIFQEKGIEDIIIFNFAIKNDYCIITADLDFGEILAYTRSKRPSTIILRLEDPRIEKVNKILAETLPKVQQAIKKGSIIVIQDKKIRIRELPI